MGTSTSAGEFSRKIVKMGTITQTRQKEIVNQAALTVKEIVYAEAASKGVMPTSKIATGRWGVRYNIIGFNNPAALVRIYGPFQLVERDTKPHDIRPRSKGRRRSGKRAIAFGQLVRASVHHPGTHGKGIFEASKVKARVAVPIIMSKKITSGWRQALR